MAGRSFDPDAAVQAYLRVHDAECRVRDCVPDLSPWVQLALPAVTLAALWLFLAVGLSARLRDFLERLTRRRWLQAVLFAPPLVLFVGLSQLPVRWWLEKVIKLQSGPQWVLLGKDGKPEIPPEPSVAAWVWDRVDDLFWPAVLASLLFPLGTWLVRRAPRWFWLAPAGAAAAYLATQAFDTRYDGVRPLTPSALKNDIDAMSRSVGHPPERVVMAAGTSEGVPAAMDAAIEWRQGKPHVTFGQPLFNDLPMRREGWFAPFRPALASEVRAVAGHELAHIRLRHAELDLPVRLLIAIALAWVAGAIARRFLERQTVTDPMRGSSDVAAAPVYLITFYAAFIAFALLRNAWTLAAEHHADAVGLEIAGDPDGMAQFAARDARGRFMDLPRVAHWLFYDHPTPGQRIRRAMTWKAEHGSRRWSATGLSGPIREPEWVHRNRERDRRKAAGF